MEGLVLKCATLVRMSYFRGVECILAAFGGMGSINDLIFHPLNGHTLSAEQTTEFNDKLKLLLNFLAAKSKKLYNEEMDTIRRC